MKLSPSILLGVTIVLLIGILLGILGHAPALAMTKGSRWVAQLRRGARSTPARGEETRSRWTRRTAFAADKPALFIGLRPGLYRLNAADFSRTPGLTTVTIPGKSYQGIVQIQKGKRTTIQLP